MTETKCNVLYSHWQHITQGSEIGKWVAGIFPKSAKQKLSCFTFAWHTHTNIATSHHQINSRTVYFLVDGGRVWLLLQRHCVLLHTFILQLPLFLLHHIACCLKKFMLCPFLSLQTLYCRKGADDDDDDDDDSIIIIVIIITSVKQTHMHMDFFLLPTPPHTIHILLPIWTIYF